MESLQTVQQGSIGSHILPFLWMKGEDPLTIREELDAIEACGIREVCLESRPHPDFCGPGWWETLDWLLPELQRRQMRCWILDDDKFPTGHAAGGFEKHPEKAKWYLGERHMDILGPCREGAVLVSPFLPKDARLLGILAFPKPDSDTYAVCSEGVLDLTGQVHNGFVYFDLPEGAYRLFVLFATQSGGGRDHYINLIDEASVRVLIDEVYEPHYRHCAAYFGNTLAGFFSDEPELGNVPGYPFDNTLGKGNQRLPWSAALEDSLRSLWKENFVQNLPALWYEAGEGTTKLRVTYMDQMTALVDTCFSGQLSSWCEAHGVEHIGHIIEDANAHARMGCSTGHYFRTMAKQPVPGIDVVHHQIVPGFTGKIHQWIAGDTDGEFFHFMLAKLASSAAHVYGDGSRRALVELFGNYGWAENTGLMTWLCNHMLVRGVNTFVPHAFSMKYPDRDCPPHFYARGNNPQYPAFIQVMQYLQRAADIALKVRPSMAAAVLYHAELEWSGSTALSQTAVRVLAEHQLDCDIVPLDVLKQASVRNGRLCFGSNSWPCLILPAVPALKDDCSVLQALAAKGIPVYVLTDTENPELPEGIAAVSREELCDAVRRHYTPSAVVDGRHPDLRLMAGRDEDGTVLFFFNESTTEVLEETVHLSQAFTSVRFYDGWKNESRSEALTGHSFCLRLLPGEAVFVYPGTENAKEPLVIEEEVVLDCDWSVERAAYTDPNRFMPYRYIAGSTPLYSLNGPSGDPGFSGFYRYEGDFVLPGSADRVCLRIPAGGESVRVLVNGQDFGYLSGIPGHVDITDALHDHDNHLTLIFATTLVWSRKDGASTHLQVGGTGLCARPILELLKRKENI